MKRLKYIFILVCAGLLFSGYLSAVKLFSDTCAFNEACPYFLGYPACWYGFAMYFIMFAVTLFALIKQISLHSALKINAVVSFLGILFAGRFVVQEVVQSQITGNLGLSTCAYGLVFYILIFALSFIAIRRSKTETLTSQL